MKIALTSVLLALALPLAAQDPAASQAENTFYKAFYLEKGQRDFKEAMVLYEQFLNAAPEHKLAGEAARQQFALLEKTGKTKDRDAFEVKYAKLLGNAPAAPERGDRPAEPAEGERPRDARGEGREGQRPDPAARVTELEKQLAKAKEEGNDEEARRLAQQIERAKQAGNRRGGMFPTKKLAEMNADELKQFKDGLAGMDRMIERMRENGNEEQAKKLETSLGDLKKNIDANKLEDAQKQIDAMRESMPRRRGQGGGGDAGGGRGGEGGGEGGGNRGGGGGGGNRGGGGGGG